MPKTNFDKTVDLLIWNRKIDCVQYDYLVSIHKYKEGEAKIQFSKIYYTDYGHKITKLGRLTSENAERLIPLIQEAIQFLKDWDGQKIDIGVDIQSGEES